MTKYSFKNGISITIPTKLSKEETIQKWTDVKMWMSVILDPPKPEPEPTETKPRKKFRK